MSDAIWSDVPPTEAGFYYAHEPALNEWSVIELTYPPIFAGEPAYRSHGNRAVEPGVYDRWLLVPDAETLRGVGMALAFAASVIKSGEPWTETCEQMIGGALAKLEGRDGEHGP